MQDRGFYTVEQAPPYSRFRIRRILRTSPVRSPTSPKLADIKTSGHTSELPPVALAVESVVISRHPPACERYAHRESTHIRRSPGRSNRTSRPLSSFHFP